MWNMKALVPPLQKLWLRISLLKKGQAPKSKDLCCCFLKKGLVTSITYVKYESFGPYRSKVKAKVKVFKK